MGVNPSPLTTLRRGEVRRGGVRLWCCLLAQSPTPRACFHASQFILNAPHDIYTITYCYYTLKNMESILNGLL